MTWQADLAYILSRITARELAVKLNGRYSRAAIGQWAGGETPPKEASSRLVSMARRERSKAEFAAVLADVEARYTVPEIAATLGVSRSTVYSWLSGERCATADLRSSMVRILKGSEVQQ